MALVMGIDDAGRGPLIGPMILAGVLLDKEDEVYLKKKGVADSKELTHPTRVELSKIIKDKAIEHYAAVSSPKEIDEAVYSINLNTLEAKKAGEIINKLNKKKEKIKVIVDCPSVNTDAWKQTMIKFIEHTDNLEIFCEHKADANHLSVSAASIIAKVTREDLVLELKKKYGEFGSGYPADPYTKAFLEKKGSELKDCGIFRKSWSTWKKLFAEDNQSTLKF